MHFANVLPPTRLFLAPLPPSACFFAHPLNRTVLSQRLMDARALSGQRQKKWPLIGALGGWGKPVVLLSSRSKTRRNPREKEGGPRLMPNDRNDFRQSREPKHRSVRAGFDLGSRIRLLFFFLKGGCPFWVPPSIPL